MADEGVERADVGAEKKNRKEGKRWGEIVKFRGDFLKRC